MNENNSVNKETSTQNTVFQSGESVILAGKYEAVGVDQKLAKDKPEAAMINLNKGELFPNYEGRAVSWRLVQSR